MDSKLQHLMDINGLSYLYEKLRDRIDLFTNSSQSDINDFKSNAQRNIDAAIENANIKAAAAQAAADSVNDFKAECQLDFITRQEVYACVAQITSFEMEIVNSLPRTGQKGYIYLMMADDGSGNDIYDEYIWIPDKYKFEKIGTTRVDLTPYATSAEVANTYLSKVNASNTYLSKTDASNTYLNKTDASNTYATKANVYNEYLQKTDASSTYVTQAAYNAKVAALEKADADNLATASGDMSANYVSKTVYNSKMASLDSADIALRQADQDNYDKLKQSDSDTLAAAKSDAASKYVPITDYNTKMSELATADSNTLATAKSYADTQDAANLTAAKNDAASKYVAKSDYNTKVAALEKADTDNLAAAKSDAASKYVTLSAYNAKVAELEKADADNLATASGDMSANYLTKSDASNTYTTKTDFNNLKSTVSGITSFELTVVTSLPSSGVKGTVYLMSASDGSGNDIYDEYIWVPSTSKFEKIGTTRIDLSPYLTKSSASSTYLGISATAAAATKLATARSINGTNFDGTGNITTASWGTARSISISDNGGSNTGTAVSVNGGSNVTLKLPSTIAATLSGNASTATKLQTARTINGTNFDGSGNITTANWGTARNITIADNGGTNTGTAVSVNGSANVVLKLPSTIAATLSGNASTATKLQTARTINGTNFDGSGNITTANWGTARNITIADSAGSNTGAAVSVNGSGNATLKLPATIAATLSGNASTATKLATARSISIADSAASNTGEAASFDGSGNVTLKLPATIAATLNGNATALQDYNTTSTKPIQLGYSGSSLSSFSYLAAYTTVNGVTSIKDVGASTVRSWLGIESGTTAPTSLTTGHIYFEYNS